MIETSKTQPDVQLRCWNAATSLLPLAVLAYRTLNDGFESAATDDLAVSSSPNVFFVGLLWTFCIMAAYNHLVPQAVSTQIVKVVFVPIALWSAPLPIKGVSLSLTLMPLLCGSISSTKEFHNHAMLLGELGGAIRQLWMARTIFFGVFFHNGTHKDTPENHRFIPLWLLLAMIICKVIYALERRDRMKRNEREKFGIWHAVEHIDVALYVMVLSPNIVSAKDYSSVLSSLLLAVVCVAQLCQRGNLLLTSKGTLFDIYGTWTVLWVHCDKPLFLLGWIVALLVPVEFASVLIPEGFQRWSMAGIVMHELATTLYTQASDKSMAFHLEDLALTTVLFGFLFLTVFGTRLPLELLRCLIAVTNGLGHFDSNGRTRLECKRALGCCILVQGALWLAYSRSLWKQRKDDPWVPSELRSLWQSKLHANCFSTNIPGFLVKPSNPTLTLESWTLKDLYQMCQQQNAGNRFLVDPKTNLPSVDLVVGITTGGAFVAHALVSSATLSAGNTALELAYLESKSWSGMEVLENLRVIVTHWLMKQDSFLKSKPKVLRWYRGKPPRKKPSPTCSSPYRRIMLVDDTVTTGRTMIHAKQFLQQAFPGAIVETLAWRAPPPEESVVALDHALEYGNVPLLCPWGFEND